jgi:hypothetical protein
MIRFTGCFILAAVTVATACAGQQGSDDTVRRIEEQRAAREREKAAANQKDIEASAQQLAAWKAASIEANEPMRAAHAKKQAALTEELRQKEEACTSSRPQRLAFVKSAITEHRAFLAKVGPGLDWERAHCERYDSRGVKVTVERSGNTSVARTERTGSGTDIRCEAPRPKGVTNEWIEEAIDGANCGFKNITVRGPVNCDDSDQKALGLTLSSTGCDDTARQDRILALP